MQRRRPSKPGWISSCRPATRTAPPWPTRFGRERWTRRWSTAPWSGCCARRPSWACSTPPSTGRHRWSPAWTQRRTERSRDDLPRRRSILLANNGTLPLSGRRRIAVVGPNADRSNALFGCYSFTNHVLDRYPDVPLGIDVPSVLDALARGATRAARSCTPRAAASMTRIARDSHRPSPLPGMRTWRSSWPATVLDSSDGAPPVRVAMSTPSSYRGCTRPRRGGPRDRHTRRPRPRDGTAVCRGLGARQVRRRGPGVLPRRGGRRGDRRRHQWSGEPLRSSPGQPPALGGFAAVFLPAPDPRRLLVRVEPRPGARSPVRFRHVVHDLRPERAAGVLTDRAHRRADRGRRPRRRTRGHAPAPTSSSCTATIPWPRSRGRWRNFSAMRACSSSRARPSSSTSPCPPRGIAFSGRDLVRAVEPGTLDLWVGGSCADSDVTGSVELIGRRHEIGPADARWVDVVVEPVRQPSSTRQGASRQAW